MKNDYKCYYCGYQSLKLLLQVGEYKLLKCRKCNNIFPYPRKHIKIKSENAKKYNSKEDERSYIGIYDQVYKKAKKYVNEIQKYKKSGKYLDIGCSYGIYLKAGEEAGFEAYGVELASNAAIYARKKLKLNVFTGAIEKAKYKPNNFDVITLYDVFEHIPDIKKFLKEINRILKPGGLLVIQCPNIESYAFRVLGKDWNWLLIPHHLWHFSKSSLSKVLIQYKFAIVRHITWDSPYDFASNWVTKLGLTEANAPLWKRLIRKVVYFSLYFGIGIGSLVWSRYNKGGSQIIYATKSGK